MEYKIEERMTERSNDDELKQPTVDETDIRRIGVDRTTDGLNPGTLCDSGPIHPRTQVFVALCLRLVVALTNDEHGDNTGSAEITVCGFYHNPVVNSSARTPMP